METGQPFSMPHDNKIIQPKELSIHLFVNGFSFCTHSKIDFVATPNGVEDFQQAFNDYLAYYPEGSFSSASAIFFQNPSCFVPLSLFDKSHAEQYVSLHHKPKESETLAFDILQEEAQVNLYYHSKPIKKILTESKIEFQCLHYNSILYKQILNLSRSSLVPYQLFLHFHSDAVDIFLVNNNTLQFNNRFRITNEDEFLYYVFFVVEQFKLKADEMEVIFLGKIKSFEGYYDAVKQYHSQIMFKDLQSPFQIDLTEHQAPYLAPFFS